MLFVDDLSCSYSWMTPTPIGWVEDGWARIVSDLLHAIDDVIAAHSRATIDVLDAGERDGALRFDFVVDGGSDVLAEAVEAVVTDARIRAAATCARCGRPGRLLLHRPGWPMTRCDDHAGRSDYDARHGALRPRPSAEAIPRACMTA